MKMPFTATSRSQQRGFLSLVFLVLMAVMVILVAANSRVLLHLHRETRLLERQQIQRLAGVSTNLTAGVTTELK